MTQEIKTKQCPYSDIQCPHPERPYCQDCQEYLESRAKLKEDIGGMLKREDNDRFSPSAQHRKNILGVN